MNADCVLAILCTAPALTPDAPTVSRAKDVIATELGKAGSPLVWMTSSRRFDAVPELLAFSSAVREASASYPETSRLLFG